MKIDVEKLKRGLEQVNGVEYMAAEQEARRRGDVSVEITFSKRFQAILAAKALNVPYEEIANLKIGDFALATMTVFNFLASSEEMAEEASPKTNKEAR